MTATVTIGLPSGARLRPLLAAAACALLAALPLAAATYYVNDSSTNCDLYCTQPGADANNGLSSATPVASLQTLLGRTTLTGSDTVLIDSGTYPASSLALAAPHGGDANRKLLIKGVLRRTLLVDASGGVAGACVLALSADRVELTGLTFTGSQVGLSVDASGCAHASFHHNIFCGNSGAGLVVERTTANNGGGAFEIHHNLFYSTGDGMRLETLNNGPEDQFSILNNTVVASSGVALSLGCHLSLAQVLNNILVAGSGGACLGAGDFSTLYSSDYNCLYARYGGSVARWSANGVTLELETLADWQRFSKALFSGARDTHSFNLDPAFANEANADYHLKSFAGRWQPASNSATGGTWVADADLHSPCIDAGLVYAYDAELSLEPSPNGGRRNLGAEGASREASKTASGRSLLVIAPDEGQVTGESQAVYWNATGTGWSSNHYVSVEYSLDGAMWTAAAGGTCPAQASAFSWDRPLQTFGNPTGCWVRVVSFTSPSCSGAAFLPYRAPASPSSVYFVNDQSTGSDTFCKAVGNTANDGLSPAAPVDSLQTILERYVLLPSTVVFVDAGTYVCASNLVIETANSGTWGQPVTLRGAGALTVLSRQSTAAGSCCLLNRASDIEIVGFTFTGAATGLAIDASFSRRATVKECVFRSNSEVGLEVTSDGAHAYGSFLIRNNLLFDTGDGLRLQPNVTNMMGDQFRVYNNTVVVPSNRTAITMGGMLYQSLLRNNIVVASGGTCLACEDPYWLFQSDRNDLWAPEGGAVGRLKINGTTTSLATLADWQACTYSNRYSARDPQSFSRDPLFASPANGDYHVKSTGGRWVPSGATSGTGYWTETDTLTSPCVDADPYCTADDLAPEPAPNGGRLNLGAYGGTAEASKSSLGRSLLLLAPDLGQSTSQPQTLYWNASGQGWNAQDTVQLDYSVSGGVTWTPVAQNALFSPSASSYSWERPSETFGVSSGCLVRVAYSAQPALCDTVLLPNRSFGALATPTVFYVNDASRTGDRFCSAVGNDANDGLSGSTPVATLQAVIARYSPGVGATIYVDAGTYEQTDNLELPDTGPGNGASNAWLQLIGADRLTVLKRISTSSNTNAFCLAVKQDFAWIEGITFKGGQCGVVINPASCRNAALVNCTVQESRGFAVSVLNDPSDEGYDSYTFKNNLAYNCGSGFDLQSAAGCRRAAFTVHNNTIAVYNGTGLACGGRSAGLSLLNNIVVAKGTLGRCLSVEQLGVLAASDYNDLFTSSGAAVAKWGTGTYAQTGGTLAEWQRKGFDAASISLDPLFVSTVSGDYHLRSTGGSWHGGAWTADTLSSPCIDAGSPASDYAKETSPNGHRINQGAYGSTAEASRSATTRLLTLLSPKGGESWSNVVTVTWSAAGNAWSTGDSVRLEYSSDGVTWTLLNGASALSPTGAFLWTIPNPTNAIASYRLRVVCNQDASLTAATDGAGQVIRVPVSYYVNDGATTGDLFCTAAGNAANSGLQPSQPLASLGDLLTRYRLAPGDVVYVDAGSYPLTSNLVLSAGHKGTADAPISLTGAGGASVLVRGGEGAAPRCGLEVHADHLRIEGLTCCGADVGISVDASTARHVRLAGNVCSNNTALGIEVRPYSDLSGEDFQLVQNLVCQNGEGLYLQSSTNSFDGRGQFMLENNTVCNSGAGIRLLNANAYKRRTNFLKNNIVEVSNANTACLVAHPGSLHYSDFNNLSAPSNGMAVAWQDGSAAFASLAAWRAASGQDKNSLSANSRFAAPEAGDYRLLASSPCVDSGILSFWMFDARDAGGNPRLAGRSADIGAFELNLRTSVRLFLQGPYLGSSELMRTSLSQSGLLPAKSPFADDPRTLTAFPSNITDWVLVQLRRATNGPALFSRSLLLRADGWLVTDAGSTNLDLDLPPSEACYLVVKHRNHLAAMTAVPVAITHQTLTCDFTSSGSDYFGGTNACVAASGANGVRWLLRAGDADSDGAVLPVDQAIQIAQLSTLPGYRRADADLDGLVTGSDSALIQSNLARQSPLPQPETALLPLLRIAPSRTTLTSGETLALSVASTSASPSSGLSLLADIPPGSSYAWSFAAKPSGAQLTAGAGTQVGYTAGPTSACTDVIEAWDASNGLGRAYVNVIAAAAVAGAGKAFVMAGRSSANDTLWPATDYLADSAYATLRYRGFSKENIVYLSPEPDQDVDGNGLLDDIDGESLFAEAEQAFTNAVSDTDRLFVYLVDHGGNSSGEGYFRLNGSQTLTATQLDAWLDALQDARQTHVTVLLDFCYAGSFLPALTYTGTATRVVVAACGDNQPSYFVAGGLVSFSSAFFSGVMLGYDVQRCFELATSAMATYQEARLDDDKDGAYTANDSAQASATTIGPSTVASGDQPQIGEVCGNQVLTDETSATLWIGSISSPRPIKRAWCLVVPPGFDPDPATPVTSLPEFELAYSEATGRYSVTYDGFSAPGTYYVCFYVSDTEGRVSVPATCYVAQLGYDDRVVLVAGGDTNSAAWPAVDAVTELAYNTLRLRLYPADHILALSPASGRDFDGDGSNDVAAVSSLASLQAAIGEWALTNATDRLTLYLLGEGQDQTFRLSASEALTTNALAQWVGDFQALVPVPVTVVLDFSGAGAFLPALADPLLAEESPSSTRIVIASARAGREALFANGGAVSFSQYLLSGVISGQTLGEAYDDARRAIRRVSGDARQQAQLDDTLDGTPNEKNVDGALAEVTSLGSTFVTGADAPVIAAVTPSTVLSASGQTATLWAAEVAGMRAISNVVCVVTPPGYSGAEDLPVLDLPWSAAALRYELTSDAFVLPGVYGLTFYAIDTAGERSDPVQSEILLADAYEPDDTRAQASLYNGSAQTHTFHAATDEDWVRVYLVTNFVYDIETYHLSDPLDTVLELYREQADGALELVDYVDEEGNDLGEYTGLDHPDSGWYWARITPYAGATNRVGAYEFSIEIPSADTLNTLIVLAINDVTAGALPTGSTVTVQGTTKTISGSMSVVFSSLTNGTYLVTVPTPTNFFPREDPNTPYQVQSLTNQSYANPRRVPVSGGWRIAGFELLSSVAVTSGVVRDAWTRAFLGGAQLSFSATSGGLSGQSADGGVILTTYRTNWLSASDGTLPTNVVLGACVWNRTLSLSGYKTNVTVNAVSNAPAGSKMALGTVYLEPLDVNTNGLADAWEALYFPGGAAPNADSDGDGLDIRSEYLCGTDPTSADSVLRIVAFERTPTQATLSWNTAAGRGYCMLSATSLLNTAAITTNGPWEASSAPALMTWSDTNAPALPARFYRVLLNAP